MRVISQDGTIDMPYEEVIIQRFRSRIYFLNKNLTGVESLSDDMQIAEYSTEAKAIKAMEMLREQHEKVAFLKTIINTEKGASFVRGLSKTDFDKMTQNYFQFPQDDEIEV
jgi:hypothetical protein